MTTNPAPVTHKNVNVPNLPRALVITSQLALTRETLGILSSPHRTTSIMIDLSPERRRVNMVSQYPNHSSLMSEIRPKRSPSENAKLIRWLLRRKLRRKQLSSINLEVIPYHLRCSFLDTSQSWKPMRWDASKSKRTQYRYWSKERHHFHFMKGRNTSKNLTPKNTYPMMLRSPTSKPIPSPKLAQFSYSIKWWRDRKKRDKNVLENKLN